MCIRITNSLPETMVRQLVILEGRLEQCRSCGVRGVSLASIRAVAVRCAGTVQYHQYQIPDLI